MTKTFTQNEIIRYLYHETSEEENAEIESALLCDTELLEVYQELSALKRQLDKVSENPHDRIINHVMNYSRTMEAIQEK